jgi:hypothetical protein
VIAGVRVNGTCERQADVVERLLVAEQGYAEMEDRWRRTADD